MSAKRDIEDRAMEQ